MVYIDIKLQTKNLLKAKDISKKKIRFQLWCAYDCGLHICAMYRLNIVNSIKQRIFQATQMHQLC